MFFSRHPKRAGQTRFLPRVEVLEERALPSTVARRPLSNGPAIALRVVLEKETQRGAPALVQIVATDVVGFQVASYRGTIHFTSSDHAARLPRDYTFRRSDQGEHDFNVTFATLGRQSVSATDLSAIINGRAPTLVVPGPVATRFRISIAGTTLAGAPASLTVAAVDAFGRVARNYTGTIHFTTSDPSAQLPTRYTFRPADHGVHVFSVTMATTGAQSISVVDLRDPALTGSADTNTALNPATQVLLINQNLLNGMMFPSLPSLMM
jgi:hypothetical protein